MKPREQREWDVKPGASSLSRACGYRQAAMAFLLAQEPTWAEAVGRDKFNGKKSSARRNTAATEVGMAPLKGNRPE